MTNGAVGEVVGLGLKETLSVAVAEVKDDAVNWDAYWLVSQTMSQAGAQVVDWAVHVAVFQAVDWAAYEAVDQAVAERGGPRHHGLGLYLKGVA